MSASDTDARIVKLWQQGVSVKAIARRIGRPDDIDRVEAGLARMDLSAPSGKKEILLTDVVSIDRRVSGATDRRSLRGDRRKPQAAFGDIDPDETISMKDLEVIK